MTHQGLTIPQELRASQQFVNPDNFKPGSVFYGELHEEWQWCRWYGGPIVVSPDVNDPTHEVVHFDDFRPQTGDRISTVGDWIVDESGPSTHSELHEIRIMAAIKAEPGCQGNSEAERADAGCAHPDTWHILTNGFFAQGTAQQDHLSIVVPVPAATNSNPTVLACDLMSALDGGCDPPGVEIASPVLDQVAGTCTIALDRAPNIGPLSERHCGNQLASPNLLHVECPCIDCTGVSIDRCNPMPGRTTLAFAGDIRAEWRDPQGLWQCACDCDDPSTPGATIGALVEGCAPGGLDPSDANVCEQACGGTFCGSAASCLIGSCHPSSNPSPAQLVGLDACEPPILGTRNASAGDYKIALSAESTATMGLIIPTGPIGASTQIQGNLWLNVSSDGTSLDFANVLLTSSPFTYPIVDADPPFFHLVNVDQISAFSENRFSAGRLPDGGYEVPSGAMMIGVRASVDGGPGGTDFPNSGAAEVAFDPSSGSFTMDGTGQDLFGNAVQIHLQGQIVNRPPVADPGPDHFVECASHTTTPVALDGSRSHDTDPGDSIAHYQWFEGNQGLSNQEFASVDEVFGAGISWAHTFDLHVYDQGLASNSAGVTVTIRDTTPPVVSDLALTGPSCFWPPNHKYVVLRVGRDITANVTDICDPSPNLIINSVLSSQPDNSVGDGNTTNDVVMFSDHICVRSERQDTDPNGRDYHVTLAGVDFSGNKSLPVSTSFHVPHDQSSHSCPGTGSLEVVDDTDPLCTH